MAAAKVADDRSRTGGRFVEETTARKELAALRS